jgi:hypothetical protein
VVVSCADQDTTNSTGTEVHNEPTQARFAASLHEASTRQAHSLPLPFESYCIPSEPQQHDSQPSVHTPCCRLLPDSVALPTQPENALSRLCASLRGPYSFVYYHASSQQIYFGRDPLGRRSLLMALSPDQQALFLVSVKPAELASAPCMQISAKEKGRSACDANAAECGVMHGPSAEDECSATCMMQAARSESAEESPRAAHVDVHSSEQHAAKAHEVAAYEEVPPGLYRMRVLKSSEGPATDMHECHGSELGQYSRMTAAGVQLRIGAFVIECLSATDAWCGLQRQLLQHRATHLIHPPAQCVKHHPMTEHTDLDTASGLQGENRPQHTEHAPSRAVAADPGVSKNCSSSKQSPVASGMHATCMHDIVEEVLNALEASVRVRCDAIDPHQGPPRTW